MFGGWWFGWWYPHLILSSGDVSHLHNTHIHTDITTHINKHIHPHYVRAMNTGDERRMCDWGLVGEGEWKVRFSTFAIRRREAKLCVSCFAGWITAGMSSFITRTNIVVPHDIRNTHMCIWCMAHMCVCVFVRLSMWMYYTGIFRIIHHFWMYSVRLAEHPDSRRKYKLD